MIETARLKVTKVETDRSGRTLSGHSFKISITEGGREVTFWGPSVGDICELYVQASNGGRGELVELGPYVAAASE